MLALNNNRDLLAFPFSRIQTSPKATYVISTPPHLLGRLSSLYLGWGSRDASVTSTPAERSSPREARIVQTLALVVGCSCTVRCLTVASLRALRVGLPTSWC